MNSSVHVETVIDKSFVHASVPDSYNAAVNELVPVDVGVPPITPVDVFSDRPDGSDPR